MESASFVRADESSGALGLEPIIGRRPERAAFAQALADGVALVSVHGPAGIGKSTLVRAMMRIAAADGRDVIRVDGRDVTPAPRAFRAALAGDGDGAAADRARADRPAIFIDTFEQMAVIDDWLRTELWPSLPAGALLVVAGRAPLSPAWARTAEALGRELRALPLRNLGRADASRLLAAHGVRAADHAEALAVTGGQPLALALLADLASGVDADPDADEVGIVHRLLRRLVADRSLDQQRALQAAAIVRTVTADRLAALLGTRDTGALFGWLGTLTCVEHGRHGLSLHDVAREVIVAELRWRDPAWYDAAVRRAHDDAFARFYQARAADQVRILDEVSYLHRYNPLAQIGLDWAISGHYLDDATVDDRPAIAAMVARHEGPTAAALVTPWLASRAADAVVFRERAGHVAGFLLMVNLDRASAAELAADPVAARLWAAVSAAGGPCARGEGALLFRSWMAEAVHHAPSPIWNLVSHVMVREGLMRPRLGWSAGLFANPDFWEPFFAYFNLQRLSGGDVEVGRLRLGVFYIDYREIPRAEFGARIGQRLEAAPSAPVRPLVTPQPALLERDGFIREVRRALRRLWRSPGHRDLLRSPLLHAPIVSGRVGARARVAERIAILRQQCDAAIARVAAAHDDPRIEAVLQATFLERADRKGPVVASGLGLSFPTYRRMLATAIVAVVDELWRTETS